MATLASMYIKYLTGAVLSQINPAGKIVEIDSFQQVEVRPDTRKQPVKKWTMRVQGLPAGWPDELFLNVTMFEWLTTNLGNGNAQVDTEDLIGKKITLVPTKVIVGGSEKMAIRFALPSQSSQLQPTPQRAPAAAPQIQRPAVTTPQTIQRQAAAISSQLAQPQRAAPPPPPANNDDDIPF